MRDQFRFLGPRSLRSLGRVENRARSSAGAVRPLPPRNGASSSGTITRLIGSEQFPFRARAVLQERIAVGIALDQVAIDREWPVLHYRLVRAGQQWPRSETCPCRRADICTTRASAR